MSDVSWVWRFLSDFWKKVPEDDKGAVESLWAGYTQVIGDHLLHLYQVDLAQGLFDIFVDFKSKWNQFTFNSSNKLTAGITGFDYGYSLPYNTITSIPTLQDKVDIPTITLTENTDYEIQSGNIYFKVVPGEKLWGKDVLFNYEWIWKNFGALIDYYEENSKTYLRAVQGLFYCYWHGATPENIRRGLYMIFNLPFALEAGGVTKIEDWVEEGVTRYAVTITDTNGDEERYIIPKDLIPVVVLDQVIEQFEPLCNGIEVYDRHNKPDFLDEVAGSALYKYYDTDPSTMTPAEHDRAREILKYSLFIPQIDEKVFNEIIDISKVIRFLRKIKPFFYDFILQPVYEPSDSLTFDDKLGDNEFPDKVTIHGEALVCFNYANYLAKGEVSDDGYTWDDYNSIT